MNGKDGFQPVSTIKYIDRHTITIMAGAIIIS